MKKIAFFGTPELTKEILDTLKEADFTPSLIITQEDKPVGRKHILTPPPAKQWGLEHSIISILQPQKMKDIREYLENENWDLFIVAAYGKILPEWLLELPKYGCINLHYSLLPCFRGASPVQAALLAGEKETGITIQKMVYELDAGDILYQEKTTIQETETFPELLSRLNCMACKILPELLETIFSGTIQYIPQDIKKVTFCSKIEKDMGRLVLNKDKETNLKNWNTYRAFYGWPGVYFLEEKNNKTIRVKITTAEFKDGIFVPLKVIPEGKRELSYLEFTQKTL
jgi:methionyl-tRNA formyltransferase